MAVSLYTVRVVLNTLGVEDYGIYNVVGGVVTMFSFLSGTMASASQRFFAFELGKKDYKALKQTFSLTVISYVGIAVLVLVIAETIGLWFLNTQMTIPANRMNAANWVYQFSILSFIMTILTIPYNAAIIAREHMKVYAYVSILDVVLKLLIVYLLTLSSFDKLKVYAVLIFCVTSMIRLVYRTYCKRNFQECKYSFYWNIVRLKEILSFAWWNMIGAVANVLKTQGVNILLNIFFGPVINAARGVAYQVNAALTNFTNNFYMAVRPQITKSYSSGDMEGMKLLVYKSSKFGFFLMMLLSIPLLVETEYILSLWLKNIPEYTVVFTRLVIINSLIDVFNYPLVNALQATGKIKFFQITVSVLVLMILPVSCLFLYLGFSPEITMIISIAVSLLCFFPRLYFVKRYAKISIKTFIQKVLLVVSIIFMLSMVLPLLFYFNMQQSFTRFMTILFCGTLFSLILIYFVGTSRSEKMSIKSFIYSRWERLKK